MVKAYEVRGKDQHFAVYSNLTYRFVSHDADFKDAQILCDKMNDDHYIDQMEQNA